MVFLVYPSRRFQLRRNGFNELGRRKSQGTCFASVRLSQFRTQADIRFVPQAQLRLTSQRLGQLQDRKDSLAHITSNDIATLLRQRNVALARAKVQNLITEDAASNALEILEMHCGVIVERFSELERGCVRSTIRVLLHSKLGPQPET